jgi:arsenate reductase (glutaredoxin)
MSSAMSNPSIFRLYGIPNCDTVKKSRAWLAQQAITVEFMDLKKQAPTIEQLTQWSKQLGWQNLLKKTGTTWRSLAESEREDLDEAKAIGLMHQHINLIKRPLLVDNNGIVLAGFKQAEWETYLKDFLGSF